MIQDVFYQKQCESVEVFGDTSDGNESNDETAISDSDHGDDDYYNNGLVISGPAEFENTLSLNSDLYETVNKVRRVVKIFKRSPLKNEILQK